MAALLALISALCYGVSDFSGGLATRRAPATAIVLVSNGLSLLLGLLAVAVVPGSVFRTADILWGLAAGAVGLLGVVLLYRGLAIGPMSVVAPLTAVLSAAVPVVAGVLGGERPSPPAIAGVILAVPAIALIAGESRALEAPRVSRGALLAALAAGLSFGGFFVLLAQTGSDGGAWPLVAQRAASVAILLAIIVLPAGRSTWPPPGGRTLGLAAIAGVTDFSANLAFLLATHRGLLALVAVLTSLYPASTVLLARWLLRERLAAQQVGGLVVAAVAVVLIAL